MIGCTHIHTNTQTRTHRHCMRVGWREEDDLARTFSTRKRNAIRVEEFTRRRLTSAGRSYPSCVSCCGNLPKCRILRRAKPGEARRPQSPVRGCEGRSPMHRDPSVPPDSATRPSSSAAGSQKGLPPRSTAWSSGVCATLPGSGTRPLSAARGSTFWCSRAFSLS